MNKKQTFILGAMAVGLSSAAMAQSFTESLDRLASENVTAGRIFCPYSVCDIKLPGGSLDVRLTPQEESKIESNLNTLNGLNIITGATLKSSIVQPKANCYNLPCPDDVELARSERKARAAKLTTLVEAAANIKE